MSKIRMVQSCGEKELEEDAQNWLSAISTNAGSLLRLAHMHAINEHVCTTIASGLA